jgi:hypothetical protein
MNRFEVVELKTPKGKSVAMIHTNAQDMDDLAAGINHNEPIEYGVPHRGWLHFSLRDATPWSASASPIKSARLTIWGPSDSSAVFLASVTSPHIAKRRVVPKMFYKIN